GAKRRGPRLLGTAPVLLAAEALSLDEALSAGLALEAEAAEEAVVGAEEVSFRQEVVIEGPDGPVTVSAVCSGFGLGGAYWLLEALGVRVAVLGAATLETLPSLRPLDTGPLDSSVAAVICLGLAPDGSPPSGSGETRVRE
ncbi:unnamed protein product, partial [Polarella glacialis]